MRKIMFMGQSGCLILVSFAVFLLVGVSICKWWKNKVTISEAVVTGFIACLAIYQLLAFPFIVTVGKLSVLTAIYVVIVIALSVYGFISLIRKNIVIELEKVSVLKGLVLVVLLLQALASSYLHSVEADDSYYVGVSTYCYEQDVICLEQTEVTTGMDYLSSTPKPQINSWEVFLASWAKIFQMKPIILAHTVFPFIAILLAFFAHRMWAEVLCKENDRDWFMLFYLFVVLFSGYSTANLGSFLLMRSWQGKTILLAVVLPALMLACYQMLYAEKKEAKYWIYNAIVLLAGVCCNPVGVYLGPLLYLMMALAYLLISDWKEIRGMVPGAVGSVIPVGMLAVYSVLSIANSTSGSYLEAQGKTWTEVFLDYWKWDNWNAAVFLVLLVISLVAVFKYANRVTKVVLVGSSVLTVGVLLNPTLYTLISQKITGVDVYWRLYWLLPFYVTVPYLFVVSKNHIKAEKYRFVVSLGICLIISVVGTNVYSYPHYFSAHRNLERIPTEVKKISDYLLEKEENSVVLYPAEFSEYMRQYTSKLRTPYTRGLYNGSRELKTTDTTLESFYKDVHYGNVKNPDRIAEVMMELEVDYFVLNSKYALRESKHLEQIETIQGYDIYEVIK